uniref:GG22137 n=2 Tax=Drosophila erecta TaxID=7220 RepID=B3P3F5_DROER
MQCKEDEVRTPFGCSKLPFLPHRDSNRVPMHHSSLYRDQVVYSNYGSARGVYQEKIKIEKEKRAPYSGPPISGHNIPRKNYILPGRLLRSGRKCRPYETPGKDGQCQHKKGKKGNYKHGNHVYGLQLRHRHDAKG